MGVWSLSEILHIGDLRLAGQIDVINLMTSQLLTWEILCLVTDCTEVQSTEESLYGVGHVPDDALAEAR